MFKFVVFALFALCAAQVEVDIEAPASVEIPAGELEIDDAIEIPSPGLPQGEIFGAPVGAVSTGFGVEKNIGADVEIGAPLPVEVAPSVGIVEAGVNALPAETLDFPVPAISAASPVINLPKGGQEVVDIPHANIVLPGNAAENKDVHINLPSPIVEAPRPIIRSKDVLFRLPQPVFYVPRPQVQHKPIVYRVGHTFRSVRPIVNTRPYVFQVPQATITGKSAYAQPIPSKFIGKSF